MNSIDVVAIKLKVMNKTLKIMLEINDYYDQLNPLIIQLKTPTNNKERDIIVGILEKIIAGTEKMITLKDSISYASMNDQNSLIRYQRLMIDITNINFDEQINFIQALKALFASR